jgi:acyl-CoA synthetase (AMP-forming)/AMP-acid ligase II
VSDASLQGDILARVSEAPEHRCLCFYGGQKNLEWLSRQQVYARAVAAAEQLKRDGVRPGDVCLVVLPSSATAANMLLAILLLGAVPLLIAPPTLVGGNLEVFETLRGAVRRTRPRVVICSCSMEPALTRLERSFPTTKFVFHVESQYGGTLNGGLEPVFPRSNDVAAMQLTSGTTAAPRICVWDHKAILAALDGMAAAMALSAADVCVNWTPLYHDMGMVNNFLLCLARGVPLVLLSPQEFVRRPVLWLHALSDSGATITWSPNFGFALTVRKAKDGELDGVRLDAVRSFWNAAERVHVQTLESFYRRFSALGVRREALKTNFGCAENIGGATFSALDQAPPCEYVDRTLLDEHGIAQISTAANDAGTVAIVSAGRAHPAVSVSILSPRGRVLADGYVGEICLQTPSRMLRYHQNARATRRALRGGLLHTGDLGYLRNGDLFWVGRLRERITIHGKKIDPSAFEQVLASTPGLREGCFVAFGVPDAHLGTERVIVVSEVHSSLSENLQELAATVCRRCFVQVGITPSDVILVQPGILAKTSSGKRRHRYFRGLYLAGALEQLRIPTNAATLAS